MSFLKKGIFNKQYKQFYRAQIRYKALFTFIKVLKILSVLSILKLKKQTEQNSLLKRSVFSLSGFLLLTTKIKQPKLSCLCCLQELSVLLQSVKQQLLLNVKTKSHCCPGQSHGTRVYVRWMAQIKQMI